MGNLQVGFLQDILHTIFIHKHIIMNHNTSTSAKWTLQSGTIILKCLAMLCVPYDYNLVWNFAFLV